MPPHNEVLPKHGHPGMIRAVQKGLDSLASQQAEDGSWIPGGALAYPTAMTGLAGTAQLSHGDSPTRGKHSKTVQGAVEFLVRCATPTGLITARTRIAGYRCTGMVFKLLFLASVYGMITKESRKQVQVAVRKAVALTSQGQSAAGGWTYTPGSGDEGSVTVTQVQALRAAHNAGFLVPRGVIEEAVKYLREVPDRGGRDPVTPSSSGGGLEAAGSPRPPSPPLSTTPASIEGAIATDCLAEYVWDQFRSTEGWNKGGGHAFYSHLYAAQGFYMAGDEYWDKYLRETRDQLIAMQAPGWLLARRRDRRSLRHCHRRDHLAASVQVSAGFPALGGWSRQPEGEAPSEPDKTVAWPGRSLALPELIRGGDAILSTTTTDLVDLTGARRAAIRPRSDPRADRRQIVGQNEVVEQLLTCRLRLRSLHPGRGARPGEDLDGALPGAFACAGFQPDPVHARPDAERHHRHRGALR